MTIGNFTPTGRQRRNSLLVLRVGFVLIFVCCLFYFTIRNSLLSQQLLALQSGLGGPHSPAAKASALQGMPANLVLAACSLLFVCFQSRWVCLLFA